MKKTKKLPRILVLTLVLLGAVSVFSVSSQEIPSTDELVKGFTSTTSFSAGAGHSAPVNTSPFLGIKAGLGATVTAPGSFLSSFSDGEALLTSFPVPITNAYFKIGLPSLDFFLLKNADAGVRVGFIPSMDLGAIGLPVPVKVNAFQIGGEFRSALIKASIFSLDVRGSFDYNSGAVAKSFDDQAGLEFGWSGISIGLRSFAGIDINWLFGVRAGAGINFNIGETSARLTTDLGDLDDYSTESTAAYSPFNLKVMGGIKLLIVDVFAEYGIITNQLAVTLMPVTLKF